MTQVSKYPISKEVEERIFEILLKTIADLRSSQEIDQFLQDFLSPVEKIMLAKRLSIAVLLAKGYDYQEIRKILRVSPPTIAQVAISLKYAGKGYKNVVERILREEKMVEFWQKVDDVIHDTIPPYGKNWSYWRKERWQKKMARRKPF
ncbi:hypothetical protein HY946_02445 [Candidatus Gottesmanbacteria bacterium]|nr:hypothetical protein [Candidatus Gottesmanbacteria bacterium]